LLSNPEQPRPSVEVAGEELATRKEVKLTDPTVEAEGVRSVVEAAAAPQNKKLVIPPCLARQIARCRLALRLLLLNSFWSPFCASTFCTRCTPRFEICIHLHSTAIESPERELESPSSYPVERPNRSI
jgi:hypothetical protein